MREEDGRFRIKKDIVVMKDYVNYKEITNKGKVFYSWDLRLYDKINDYVGVSDPVMDRASLQSYL